MSIRSLTRIAATVVATAGLAVSTAALLPGTAAATTYTCSNGHLYADGVHVVGDRVSDGRVTIGCSGSRVTMLIRQP